MDMIRPEGRSGYRLLTAGLATILLLAGCVTAPEPNPLELYLTYSEDRPFPESQFTTVAGVRIHYRVWTPDATPLGKIMLIHGLGGSTFSFRSIAPALARAGYAVVALDLPGFGFSDPGRQFVHTLENRSELLWTIADRIDTEPNSFPPADPWFLLGHSIGGQVVSRMALDRPARTLGLIVIDSDVAHPKNGSAMMWFPPARWILDAWLNNSLYTPDGVAQLLRGAYGREPTPEEIAGYYAPLQRDGMDKGFVQFARTARDNELPLESITAPVFLIWGEDDTWVRVKEADRATARFQRSTLVTIPGAGHVPMDTHPEITTQIILEWLASQR